MGNELINKFILLYFILIYSSDIFLTFIAVFRLENENSAMFLLVMISV